MVELAHSFLNFRHLTPDIWWSWRTEAKNRSLPWCLSAIASQFSVIWDVGWHFDKVKRLALRFNAEDPQNFALRVKGPALFFTFVFECIYSASIQYFCMSVVKCK